MNKAKAKQFATRAHQGQSRKTTQTDTPYIEHPIRVAKTLEKAGFSEEVVMAAYLHDTIEDTTVTTADIEKAFGPEVLQIVLANTENKNHTWESRKQHTIEWVREAPLEIKALIVADKLDNLSSIIEEYSQVGDKVWSAFHRGKDKQAWYYRGIAANCMSGLQPNQVPDFFYTYKEKVTNFF